MAAEVLISSSLTPKLFQLIYPSTLLSPARQHPHCSPSKSRTLHLRIHAKLGGGEGEVQQGGKKKFITKEEEPEQYWQTAGERKGENPMKTPLPYIIIFGYQSMCAWVLLLDRFPISDGCCNAIQKIQGV